MKARTLYDKIWDAHLVERRPDGMCLLYVDRHLIHEVTSPQAFEGLRIRGRAVRRPDLTLAVPDHNIPTSDRRLRIEDRDSARQLELLADNAAAAGIHHIGAASPEQGIVHVVGPEQGFTLPGAIVVCGDSHTSAHGALGALAFGIGTSEIEHVLATQTLWMRKSKAMEVRIDGRLGFGVSAKDLILSIIARIGTGGATGHVVEFRGPTVREMSIEGRLTICNMAIEAGARAALVAPDDKVLEYLAGRPLAPRGRDWDAAVEHWRSLPSDPGALFDAFVEIDAAAVEPTVTWGTSPADALPINAAVPDPASFEDPDRREAARRSLDYLGLMPGQKLRDIAIEHVFIGSCTNSRIEDLRAAAEVLKGRRIAAGIRQALVVPGSGLVKKQAEQEGLDEIFKAAGFDWREPGCSMCLAMNPDRVPPGERCASTSNRNFIGRQGPGSRTHLLSPAMAAAAAVAGRLTDVRALGG